MLTMYIPIRRNRYIVECKVIRKQDVIMRFFVEIDTLWNVKSERMHGMLRCVTVEIDTLWNVK